MSDTPATTEPAKKGDAESWIQQLAWLCVVTWVVTLAVSIINYAQFSRDRGTDGISAPQISQVADEALMATIPFVVGAMAVTGFLLCAVVLRWAKTLA